MTLGDTETVNVAAHDRSVKRLGEWTTASRFDVRASRGIVVLDFLTSRIAPGDIDIHLDLDHAVVKLLIPEGARIDHDDLRRVGRCRIKDWTGEGAAGGRWINLRGEPRNAEIRVHRGGIAILCRCCSAADPSAQSGKPTVTDYSDQTPSDPWPPTAERSERGTRPDGAAPCRWTPKGCVSKAACKQSEH